MESSQPLRGEDNIPYIDANGSEDDKIKDQGVGEMGKNGTKAPSSVPYNPSGILSLFGKWSFPWLLTVSIIQLSIYLNKLYQDSAAVAVYFDGNDVNFCIVSASCLFIPALVYIIYVVAEYLKQQDETEGKEVGTRVIHGMLLVPWQIKGRVEVLHFSAQRVCQRRALTPEEMDEKSSLERQAAVLAFFEEFYAGFIQLLLQLYIIIISLDTNVPSKALPAQIAASGLTLMSMMLAIRRKDDGIMTGTLSVLGWLCMMISRCIALAMATTVIHGWMLPICLIHGALMSIWISSIAFKSYQTNDSSQLSNKRKVSLFFLIFTVFGLPSLTYWPIMFQLRKKQRPLIFLFVMLVENSLLFGAWYFLKDREEWLRHDYILTLVMVGGYFIGTMFIFLYICCKPKYTDQVVYHDMKVQNAQSFGMYFEFCDAAFWLPKMQALESNLEKVRQCNIEIFNT